MGFYDRYILPKVIDMACAAKPIARQRQMVVPRAQGRVLEIGIGSGLNLAFYDPAKVDHVIGLDPAPEMLRYARRRSAGLPFTVEYLPLKGEAIPLDAKSIDTVLVTYALCTIPDPAAALQAMRRVLKPGGRLIFCEHGKGPGRSGAALAKPPQPLVVLDRRRLQPQPRHPGPDQGRRLRHRRYRNNVPPRHPPLRRLQLLGFGPAGLRGGRGGGARPAAPSRSCRATARQFGHGAKLPGGQPVRRQRQNARRPAPTGQR